MASKKKNTKRSKAFIFKNLTQNKAVLKSSHSSHPILVTYSNKLRGLYLEKEILLGIYVGLLDMS